MNDTYAGTRVTESRGCSDKNRCSGPINGFSYSKAPATNIIRPSPSSYLLAHVNVDRRRHLCGPFDDPVCTPLGDTEL